MFFDLSLDKLKEYKGSSERPKDFDSFWERTLKENSHDADAKYELKNDYCLKLFDTWEVNFAGFGENRIYGWYIAPKDSKGKKLTCVMYYPGYGGARDLPYKYLMYPSAGYSMFVMEARGQGAEGITNGGNLTYDPSSYGPHSDGFMTKGILNKDEYYYRRVFIDSVKAIEAAKQHELTDKIVISGMSQGGGMSLASTYLAGKLDIKIEASLIDVPFLCDFRRATTIVDSDPYRQIARFCIAERNKENQVFETLSYFDGVFFAKGCKTKALFSTALMDMICPPSTVFAAYNNYAGEKNIEVYTFNGHEGGDNEHNHRKLTFLNKHGI